MYSAWLPALALAVMTFAVVPVAEGPFDLIVCADVLGYVGDAELRRGLRSVAARFTICRRRAVRRLAPGWWFKKKYRD